MRNYAEPRSLLLRGLAWTRLRAELCVFCYFIFYWRLTTPTACAAMRELLVTYLAVTVSIAWLLTGPDEDEFGARYVMALDR